MTDYIQYFGNLTMEICLDGVISLFDINTKPKLYSEPRLVSCKLDVDSVKKCDFIFSTDEREECCEPESIEKIVNRTYAYFIAPPSAIEKVPNIPKKFKIDVKEGEKFSLKNIDIEVTQTSQPRAIYSVGFILKSKNHSVFFAGQTYSFTHLSTIKAEIAILPIKGTQMMDYFDALEAIKQIRPKFAIPIAYENNPDGLSDVKEFVNKCPEYTKPIVLKPGQLVKLP